MRKIAAVVILGFMCITLAVSAQAATACTTNIGAGKCAVGNLCIVLNWTPPSGFSVAGYNIYQGTTSNGENLATPINPSLITGTTYEVDNVSFGTAYYFEAETVETGGFSSGVSNETCAQTPTAPTAPTNFTANPEG